MNKSDSIKEIGAALSKAQVDVGSAIKKKRNPAFPGTMYADLDSVWDAIQPVLESCGLALAFFPGETIEKTHHIEYILTHTSGEWLSGVFSSPIAKLDPQGVGSAITYARRYIASAVFGICPEDDDGNKASNTGNQTSTPNGLVKPNPAPPKPVVNTTQASDKATVEMVTKVNGLISKNGLDGVVQEGFVIKPISTNTPVALAKSTMTAINAQIAEPPTKA